MQRGRAAQRSDSATQRSAVTVQRSAVQRGRAAQCSGIGIGCGSSNGSDKKREGACDQVAPSEVAQGEERNSSRCRRAVMPHRVQQRIRRVARHHILRAMQLQLQLQLGDRGHLERAYDRDSTTAAT